ncbi:unnamed protein product [Eruca vesicaria subsp. sativa]|uniref:Uncharacterized protein n=1 Tax=Eruca vesicaria subsp. sativa TaxID=29727 RepID=A0ABC8JQX3_ERUVS|nr:unnamed protein product [Eruca vesicaria subsp. sativa]
MEQLQTLISKLFLSLERLDLIFDHLKVCYLVRYFFAPIIERAMTIVEESGPNTMFFS